MTLKPYIVLNLEFKLHQRKIISLKFINHIISINQIDVMLKRSCDYISHLTKLSCGSIDKTRTSPPKKHFILTRDDSAEITLFSSGPREVVVIGRSGVSVSSGCSPNLLGALRGGGLPDKLLGCREASKDEICIPYTRY